MATKISVIPSFLLKGVSPQKLLLDYQAGLFNRPVNFHNKIKISSNNPIMAPVYGNSSNDAIYAIKDRNNCTIVVATSNHGNVEIYNKDGLENACGGRCDLCKQDFTHKSIGYPLAYEEKSILTNVEGLEARYLVKYTFWTEGEFCSYECALGYIRIMLGRPADQTDSTIKDSESMLHLLYKLQYPDNTILNPAADPKLLKNNKGSLTTDEWKDKRHVYKRTDRVVLLPGKVEYARDTYA